MQKHHAINISISWDFGKWREKSADVEELTVASSQWVPLLLSKTTSLFNERFQTEEDHSWGQHKKSTITGYQVLGVHPHRSSLSPMNAAGICWRCWGKDEQPRSEHQKSEAQLGCHWGCSWWWPCSQMHVSCRKPGSTDLCSFVSRWTTQTLMFGFDPEFTGVATEFKRFSRNQPMMSTWTLWASKLKQIHTSIIYISSGIGMFMFPTGSYWTYMNQQCWEEMAHRWEIRKSLSSCRAAVAVEPWCGCCSWSISFFALWWPSINFAVD